MLRGTHKRKVGKHNAIAKCCRGRKTAVEENPGRPKEKERARQTEREREKQEKRERQREVHS